MKRIFWFLLIIFSIFNLEVYSKTVLKLPKDKQEFLDNLIARMTIEEKIGQLCQVAFDKITPKNKKMIINGEIGLGLNVWTLDAKNKAQKIAVEKSRLGIPILFGGDIIHGYRTIFPLPLGQAASWNPELIKSAAEIAAAEGTAAGFKWTYSPMLEVARDPRWGRVEGTFGEDPYLVEVFGRATIAGYQGDNLALKNSLAATAKHFLGYSAPQAGIESYPSFIPKSQINNIYLPPFQAAIEEGVTSFMTSFNELNGIPCSGNKFYVKEVLKDKLGFKGFVTSDYCSIPQLQTCGYTTNSKDSALKAFNAGVDVEMVSQTYKNNLKELLEQKKISISTLDDAVRRVLRIKLLLGLFETPYTDTERIKSIFSAGNREIARQLARESVIMLKNDNNILPLSKKIKSIAVIGPLADSKADLLGVDFIDGKPEEAVTPLEALKKYLGNNVAISYEKGLESTIDNKENGFKSAVAAAKKSDITLLFLGEGGTLAGEGNDRAFLDLPGAQFKLLDLIDKEASSPIILIIFAGRPLTFPKAIPKVDAILYGFHLGTMGGPAIVDLIFGDFSPSGKLPISFPRAVGQIPIFYNHKHTPRPKINKNSRKNLNDGEIANMQQFKSQYLDLPITPQYSFGYGLSYGKFKYSGMNVSSKKLSMNDTLGVSFSLKNEGNIKAKEVAQLYIRDVCASLTRPVKELKKFKKIELRPGESKTIEFELKVKELGFYTKENKYIVEPGEFYLWVGSSSSDDTLKEKFEVIE